MTCPNCLAPELECLCAVAEVETVIITVERTDTWLCLYCGSPFEDTRHDPYCSAECVIDAQNEGED